MPVFESIHVSVLPVEQIKMLLANKQMRYFVGSSEGISDDFIHYLAQNQPALLVFGMEGKITNSGFKALENFPLKKFRMKLTP